MVSDVDYLQSLRFESLAQDWLAVQERLLFRDRFRESVVHVGVLHNLGKVFFQTLVGRLVLVILGNAGRHCVLDVVQVAMAIAELSTVKLLP